MRIPQNATEVCCVCCFSLGKGRWWISSATPYTCLSATTFLVIAVLGWASRPCNELPTPHSATTSIKCNSDKLFKEYFIKPLLNNSFHEEVHIPQNSPLHHFHLVVFSVCIVCAAIITISSKTFHHSRETHTYQLVSPLLPFPQQLLIHCWSPQAALSRTCYINGII